MAERHSYDYIKNKIESFGIKLISTEYYRNNDKLSLECPIGHRFLMCFADLISNRRCPECRKINMRRKFSFSIGDVRKKIEELNGTLLSDEYINCHQKLKIICNNGHIFYMNLNNIENGKWCSECKISGPQNQLSIIFQKIFPLFDVKINFNGFEWLKTHDHFRQQIDIYIPQLKLAVEYDGGQHFVPVKLWGGKDALNKIKRLDKLKNKKIKQHPEDIKYFIRFNYKEKITKEYVIEKLSNFRIPL